MRLPELISETLRARWAGRPTEEELYSRAQRVARRLPTGVRVGHIKTGDLSRIQRELLAEGRSPGTVNRTMGAFGTVLRHGRDMGLEVPAMPARLVEGGREPRALTDEEFGAIMAAIAPGMRPLAQFLRHTGLRISEVLALRNGDRDYDGTHVTVIRAKGGRVERLPLSRAARRALRDTVSVGDRPIFDTTYPRFLRAWKEAVTRALGSYGPEVGPHSLRRSFATELHRKGTPIKVIQRLLGHRSVRTTERYIAISDEDLMKALEDGP